MKELQLFLQELTDPLVLWQRVTLLLLLFLVLVGLFSLWRIRKHKRRMENARSQWEVTEFEKEERAALFNVQEKQQLTGLEDTSSLEQPQVSAPIPVETATVAVSGEAGSESSSTVANDSMASVNRIIACWKRGQSNEASKAERIGALQEGLVLLQQLPISTASSEVKNDWPFMFEGELRRLKNAD